MTVMTSWDLFDDLRSAQDELVRQSRMPGHWASGQFGQQHGAGAAGQPWAPAVDITECNDAYLVTADLPGFGTDDLEITFQDGLLTIQGERHRADAAGEKVHRAERRYGAFHRSITLPTHIQAAKIDASAQDGVLQILVPKAEEVHAKRIQVRAGKAKPAVAVSASKNGA
ncbi:MAG: Hsp20/alpha crystallin family protein [Streptosporangiaceae bacterium]